MQKSNSKRDYERNIIKFKSIPQLMGEPILLSNSIFNKMTLKKMKETSYELWNGHPLSYRHLKVWECLVKVEVPKPNKVKIVPKTIDCIFIGWSNNSSAYPFLKDKSEI